MHFIGIDIGGASSKVAVMDEHGKFCELFLLSSGFSAVRVAWQIKQNLEQKGYAGGFVTATGYGRVSVEYAQLSMSEILCHVLGAHFLFEPDCTVEGVGGQDTKAIKTLNGKPADFIMNDKCSAGTGKFLEISSGRLGLELSEIYKTARKNPAIKLSPYARYLPRPSSLSANGVETGEEIDFDIEAEKYLSGDKKNAKVIPFWPGFLAKDFMYIRFFMIFFFYLVCFHFNFAMDPINFEPGNALKTPPHIYPEWYFLWQYEILRGFFFDIFGFKAYNIGLIAFAIAGVALFFMPLYDRSDVVAPAHERKGFFVWFWLLVVDMIVLTIFGKLPADGVTLGISNSWIGFYSTITFFVLLFVVLPIITTLEKKGAVK